MLIRFGALGDTLMLTPAIRYLAERAGAPIHFAGRGPWSRLLFAADPDVASVAEITSKRMPLRLDPRQRSLVRWLGALRGARVLDLEGDRKSAELLAAAGVPRTRVWRLPRLGPSPRHRAMRNLDRARLFYQGEGALDTDMDCALSLTVTAQWQADAQSWLTARGWAHEPLVLLAPGNKRTMSAWRRTRRASNRKHWPESDWAALIDRIAGLMPAARFLITGAPAEQRIARTIAALASSGQVQAQANAMPITRMLAIMARAHSTITLDSGPAHAAAAVDCPLVALFNATDPRDYRPLAAAGRIQLVTPPGTTTDDWRPGRIEVEQVTAAWQRLPVGRGQKKSSPPLE